MPHLSNATPPMRSCPRSVPRADILRPCPAEARSHAGSFPLSLSRLPDSGPLSLKDVATWACSNLGLRKVRAENALLREKLDHQHMQMLQLR
jgi:hypothetical protein